MVEWDTDELGQDDVTHLTVPRSFRATVGDVVMDYKDASLVRVEGHALDLSALTSLDRKARHLVAHTADGKLAPPPSTSKTPGTRHTGVKSPEFLSEVAEAFSMDGYEGVQARFDVGRRQASRYISRARDAGLIER